MDHFIYKQDDDAKLFRVFKIEHLRSWLSNGELYFPRPQNWEDPFENILLKQKYHRAGTTTPLDFSNVLDHYFGQCWTHAPEETDATWRIYAPGKDGVRVETTVAKMYAALVNAFGGKLKSDFYICRVDYYDAGTILKHASLAMQCLEAVTEETGESCLMLLTVKRPEFAHEKEVRIILHDKSSMVSSSEKCVLVPVNPRDVISRVTFDPRLNETAFSELKAEVESRLPGVEVAQSHLYHLDVASVPVYELSPNVGKGN